MSSDNYIVSMIPVELEGLTDRDHNLLKPIPILYCPVQILKKMGWTKDTNIIFSIEKDHIKILKSANEEPTFYDINELIYEPFEDDI